MTIHREIPSSTPDRREDLAILRLQNAADLDLRFDRIEQRLASLERMLGELREARGAASGERGGSAVRIASELPVDATPLAPSSVPSIPHPATSSHEDDAELDASVRDYVARLLRKDEANPADSAQESEPSADAPANIEPSAASVWRDTPEESPLPMGSQEADETPEAACAACVPELSSPPSDPPPLRLPPEREANLDALREVANLSATAAIRTYERSQAVRKTADRLPLLFIGLACGLMLLYSACASGQTALFVGAGAAFVGAALAGSQLLVILSRWLAASQPLETR